MNYYEQIKGLFISNEVYKKVKDYSKNKSEVETYNNYGVILRSRGRNPSCQFICWHGLPICPASGPSSVPYRLSTLSTSRVCRCCCTICTASSATDVPVCLPSGWCFYLRSASSARCLRCTPCNISYRTFSRSGSSRSSFCSSRSFVPCLKRSARRRSRD